MKKIIVSLGILLNVFILASCFSGGGGYVEPTQQEHKEHEWTSWEIVHEPRCDQPGLERRDCPICGEFEEREIEFLLNNGFEVVSLGKRILRSETAPLFLMSVIGYMYECGEDNEEI